MRDFDAAPRKVREGVRARQVARFFLGSWPLAKQAAVGGRLPTNLVSQARRKRLSKQLRVFARHKAGLYEWLDDDPERLTQSAYNRWRVQRNQRLREGERPVVQASTIRNGLSNKPWDEIVSEARAGRLLTPVLREEEGAPTRLKDEELDELESLGATPTAQPGELVFDGPLLARRLYAGRKSAGLTLAKLGQLSGVDPSTITRIEGGGRMEKTSFSVVVKLARALGVSVDYFATRDGRDGLTPGRATSTRPTARQHAKWTRERQGKRSQKQG